MIYERERNNKEDRKEDGRNGDHEGELDRWFR